MSEAMRISMSEVCLMSEMSESVTAEAEGIDAAEAEARAIYADSCLRAFGWHIREMQRSEREYAELTRELEAALVSSPRIKSPEEARYQSSPSYSTGGMSVRLMEILDDRQERQDDFDHAVKELNRIGRFLRRLSPEDVELIYRRYEWRQSLKEISTAMYMSHETVRKRIASALAEFPVK